MLLKQSYELNKLFVYKFSENDLIITIPAIINPIPIISIKFNFWPNQYQLATVIKIMPMPDQIEYMIATGKCCKTFDKE